MKKYARLAGVAGVTPPTCRHSVATRLVRDPEMAGLADPACAAAFGTVGSERLKRLPQDYAEVASGIEFIGRRGRAGRRPGPRTPARDRSGHWC